MQKISLGPTNVQVTRLCLGCMQFAGDWSPEAPVTPEARLRAREAFETALDLGINFFDHADIYCWGRSESVFGDLVRELGLRREDLILQTKCGIRLVREDENLPFHYNFSADHILKSVDGSLRRLGTDYVDVLLLHRPDMLMDAEEIAGAFDQLHVSGKVRFFGVSNHTPWQMDLLRGHLRQPLVANQIELNPIKTSLLDAGIVARSHQPSPGTVADGTLEYNQLHRLQTQAWSPLALGKLTAADLTGEEPRVRAAGAVVAELAERYGVPGDAIVVAWLLRHPAKIVPVLGSRTPERLRAAAEGLKVDLSREDWYRLTIAGRGADLP